MRVCVCVSVCVRLCEKCKKGSKSRSPLICGQINFYQAVISAMRSFWATQLLFRCACDADKIMHIDGNKPQTHQSNRKRNARPNCIIRVKCKWKWQWHFGNGNYNYWVEQWELWCGMSKLRACANRLASVTQPTVQIRDISKLFRVKSITPWLQKHAHTATKGMRREKRGGPAGLIHS